MEANFIAYVQTRCTCICSEGRKNALNFFHYFYSSRNGYLYIFSIMCVLYLIFRVSWKVSYSSRNAMLNSYIEFYDVNQKAFFLTLSLSTGRRTLNYLLCFRTYKSSYRLNLNSILRYSCSLVPMEWFCRRIPPDLAVCVLLYLYGR